jgi:hypothetical protein
MGPLMALQFAVDSTNYSLSLQNRMVGTAAFQAALMILCNRKDFHFLLIFDGIEPLAVTR